MTSALDDATRPAPAPTEAPSTTPSRLDYQPALDGLRGLAIIAVMVYHLGSAGIPWAPGGFIGVDLFFVLSGFLITSLLLIEHGNSRGIVTLEFWKRRARRLLPPVFVLLVIVAVYAVFFAKAYEIKSYRMDSMAMLLYFQNYWQIYADDHTRSPISHTWSLSIEEQYYLVWPFVLYFVMRATRGRSARVVTTLVALALASAVLMSVRYTPRNPFAVYNATQTRVQALLLGAALAALALRWKGPATRVGAIALEASGFACLAWLVLLTMTVNFATHWMYHGGFFLVAAASAVIIAAATQTTSRRLRAVLSWRVLVGIGLISYGLYLYHVAVYMALDPRRVGFGGVRLLLLRWAVAGTLAVASYFLIERPIRRRSIPKGRRFVLPVAAVMTIVLLFIATTGGTAIPPSVTTQYSYWSQAARSPDAVRVLVAGDSLATTLTRSIGGAFFENGVRGTVGGAIGCGISGEAIAIGKTVFPTLCAEWRAPIDLATEAFSPHVAVIMIGPSTVFDQYVDGEYLRFGTRALKTQLYAELDEAREALTAHGARLMLATVPCMQPPTKPPNTFANIQREVTRIAWLNSVWHSYVREHKDVQLVELNAFLCTRDAKRRPLANRVTTEPNGITLTQAGALSTWRLLAKAATSRPTPDADPPVAP